MKDQTIAQFLNIKEFPFEVKDSNNNEIYSENSDNEWSKCEIDENGKIIYLENSNGYSSKYERDENGEIIYYENSDGTIIDNRPKSFDGKVH
jgi:hypothetical protein